MRNYQKYLPFGLILLWLLPMFACQFGGVGGVGWDETDEIEKAKQFSSIESGRISTVTEGVAYGTYKQEFEGVFDDFPYKGNSVGASTNPQRTQINGTPYSVSYENFVLTVFRENVSIATRRLPTVFYMHPVSSGAILRNSASNDRVLCRTLSRATTGLHYVLIVDGSGEILFEKVMPASEDWDILFGPRDEVIIGGARTRTIIYENKGIEKNAVP
ncbi:MAG: hypothetical protein IT173_01625 [Acidobacteria bacterium]|nr:hypothetical protein [Acidobacteriota bacterium]